MRCQLTSLGIHSVANGEKTLTTSAEPHLGQGGASSADAETSSSKRSSHCPQRYS